MSRINPLRPPILDIIPNRVPRTRWELITQPTEVTQAPLQPQYDTPTQPTEPVPAPPPAAVPKTPLPVRTPGQIPGMPSLVPNPMVEEIIAMEQLQTEANKSRVVPDAFSLPNGAAPFAIERGSPLYDGDFITISSKAWSTGDGQNGIILRRNGDNLTGDSLRNLQGNLRRVGVRHGPHQFLIRKVETRNKNAYWALKNPNLSGKIETIGWHEPFILVATDKPNAVLRTSLVDRTAFARVNEGREPYFGEFPAVSRDGRNHCTEGPLGMAKDSSCIDALAQSVAVWYFEKPAGQFALSTPSYVDIVSSTKDSASFVLIRNYYAYMAHNPVYNGGRNLTLDSGSNGRKLHLATHNNDSDDKQRWLIATYKGDLYPIQRYNVNTQGQVIDPPSLETETLNTIKGQVDPRNAWERFFASVTGTDWLELNFAERLAIKAAGGMAGVLLALTVADKAISHVI